jgi:hypothetical protein
MLSAIFLFNFDVIQHFVPLRGVDSHPFFLLKLFEPKIKIDVSFMLAALKCCCAHRVHT